MSQYIVIYAVFRQSAVGEDLLVSLHLSETGAKAAIPLHCQTIGGGEANEYYIEARDLGV